MLDLSIELLEHHSITAALAVSRSLYRSCIAISQNPRCSGTVLHFLDIGREGTSHVLASETRDNALGQERPAHQEGEVLHGMRYED
jgi:hypothetical protein